jgi:hypothetical protein
LPPGPHVADAGSLAEAFRAAAELRPEIRSEVLGQAQPDETLFADIELTGARGGADVARPDYRLQSIERRRDRSVSRRRWQFALRDEAVLVPAGRGPQP